MHVQWFAHLPGLQLESAGAIELLEGRLASIPFEQWCELDPSFPNSEDRYKKTEPVFYIGSAVLEGELKDILNQVSKRLYRLYYALLLDARVPLLPDPHLSVHYVRVELSAGIATYRLVGPFEREWILYGNRTSYVFDHLAVEAASAVYNMLWEDEAEMALPGVLAGIETLVRTSTPDVWWELDGVDLINDFVQCTAALEHLLLPPSVESNGMKRTPAFGQHAAVLVSDSRHRLEDLSVAYAGLYRLRNQLMHGQMTMADLSDADKEVLKLGRILLREVLLKGLALNKRSNGLASMALMLQKAYEDETFHQTLHHGMSQYL